MTTTNEMQIEYLCINELLDYKRQLRKPKSKQIEKTINLIRECGIAQPIVIDKDNHVVIGWHFVEAARQMEIDTLPTVRVDYLSEGQVNLLRIAYERIAEDAEWDMQEEISLSTLRERWTDLWGFTPHKFIGQAMLEKSIAYKEQELLGEGLTKQHKERLDMLIKQYKRNPNCFDDGRTPLKPGTRLVKNWQGKRHTVLVKSIGFDYNGTHYKSLSTIANTITGSRWNGYLFFGLKS